MTRRKLNLTEADAAEIGRLHLAGLSTIEIGSRYGCLAGSVQRRLTPLRQLRACSTAWSDVEALADFATTGLARHVTIPRGQPHWVDFRNRERGETMAEQGLWFIREGVEQAEALGRWEVWFRPVHGAERRHGVFPTQDYAVEVANRLNELGRRPAATKQGDGDPGTTEADKGYS